MLQTHRSFNSIFCALAHRVSAACIFSFQHIFCMSPRGEDGTAGQDASTQHYKKVTDERTLPLSCRLASAAISPKTICTGRRCVPTRPSCRHEHWRLGRWLWGADQDGNGTNRANKYAALWSGYSGQKFRGLEARVAVGTVTSRLSPHSHTQKNTVDVQVICSMIELIM